MSKNTIKAEVLAMSTEKDMDDVELAEYFRKMADFIEAKSQLTHMPALNIKIEVEFK